MPSKGVREKTGTAVGIEQHLSFQSGRNVFQQDRSDEIIRLCKSEWHALLAQSSMRTIGETLLTQLLQFFVQLGSSDLATLNIHDLSAVFGKKTETPLFRMYGDSIPKSVWIPTRD